MSKIRSMTAFTRLEDQSETFNLTWELKSVNHRYLDVSIRLPEKLRHLETELRQRLRKNLDRGKIEVGLRIEEQDKQQAGLEIDEALVKQLNQAKEKIESLLVAPQSISAADIMRWPGVISAAKLDVEAIESQALVGFDKALVQFIENREREGEELKGMLSQRLEKIDGYIALFRNNLPLTLANHKAKLETRLEKVLERMNEQSEGQFGEQVDNNRLEQELILFAQKVDIEEELDRLTAHCKEVARILNKGGSTGRQLDFLMQELNREANTTGSKSASAEQSQAVVDLKVCIEQMREQVQNIE